MAITPAIETKLLIHSDTTDGSTAFVDSSNSGHIITPADTHHEIDEQKFGATSIEFTAASLSRLDLPDSLDWHMGTGNWTVDFWIKRKTIGTSQYILGQGPTNGATIDSGFIGFRFDTTNKFRTKFLLGDATNYYHYTSGTIADITTWHHIALVRNGDLYTVYVDGVADTSTHDVTGYDLANSAYKLVWGQLGEYVTQSLNAYIDEIRILKGIAAWTADFTPPTTPYELEAPALSVSGTITEEGSPVARTVRAYNRSTGAFIAGAVSSAVDGSYNIELEDTTEVFVVALDDAAGTQYNAVILDKITPS